MKLIPLTLGKFAKVDDEDFDYLNQWKWHCSKQPHTNYAERRKAKSEGGKLVKMHRILLGLTNPKELCDHIDMDGLNNQRGNLRKATSQQNIRNRKSEKNSTSKYKGVYRRYGKSVYNGKKYEYTYWCAGIRINNIEKILGLFKYDDNGEIEAAKKYDEAAKVNFGEFANLNFKDDTHNQHS